MRREGIGLRDARPCSLSAACLCLTPVTCFRRMESARRRAVFLDGSNDHLAVGVNVEHNADPRGIWAEQVSDQPSALIEEEAAYSLSMRPRASAIQDPTGMSAGGIMAPCGSRGRGTVRKHFGAGGQPSSFAYECIVPQIMGPCSSSTAVEEGTLPFPPSETRSPETLRNLIPKYIKSRMWLYQPFSGF